MSTVGVIILRLQGVELVCVVLRRYQVSVVVWDTSISKNSEEEWMFWCEVDDGEECEDVKEGRSFEACLSGWLM